MVEENRPIERLMQDARILGASRIIADNADPASVTPEQRDAVLAAIRAYHDRSRRSFNEISRTLGLHGTEMARLLSGKPVARWQAIVCELDRYLEIQSKAEQSSKPAEYISTRVAEEIRAIAEVTASMRCIGLVCGPSGIGKTLALKAIAADRPGTMLVSMQTVAVDTRSILTAIATAAGIRAGAARQAEMAASIIKAIEGTGRLLIVDEIQKLCSRLDMGLHVLRDIHDATKTPMLWSGSIDLIAYLEKREAGGHEPLSQIRSRIGIARHLGEGVGDGGDDPRGGGQGSGFGAPLFSVDEVRKLFSRSKMRLTPEAVYYLWKISNLPEGGALRTCSNLVAMAEKINAAKGAIDEAMLRAAHRLLVSGHAYASLAAQLEPVLIGQAVRVG